MQTVAGARNAAQTRAAARLMTLLENEPHRLPELFRKNTTDAPPRHPYQTPADRPPAAPSAEDWPQPRMVLGITGAPGAGKSTLTDALVAAWRGRFPETRIGVIAVDPSSPFTGGAVLGDRVRMMRHATDPMVFVRSLATRGHLGGLSLGVRGVVHVLALLGCDLVVIETVGVGQSEVEIAQVADLTAIVFAPGQGDSIQLLKAGLMEIGDFFIVNKADRLGAEELHAQILAALKLGVIDEQCGPHHGMGLPPESAPVGDEPAVGSPELGMMRSVTAERSAPEVYLVSAVEQVGLDKLLDGLEARAQHWSPRWRQWRREAIRDEIRDAVLEEARRRVQEALGANGTLGGNIERVLSGEVSVAELAKELLAKAGKEPGDSWPVKM